MKKIFICFIVVFIIVLFVLLGLFVFNNIKDFQENGDKLSCDNKEKINSVTVSNEKEKISPNAKVIFETCYKKCGHIKIREEKIKTKLVNCAKEDLEKEYSQWELINYDSNGIKLKRQVEGNCGEHYVIRKKDNVIAVYIQDDNENEKLFYVTDLIVNYLPIEDVEQLNQGIFVIGEESLNALLENYE